MKQLFRIVLKTGLLVVLVYAAILYLRLGWFLPIAWGVGLLAAVLLTSPEWKTSSHRYLALVIVMVFYALAVAGIWVQFVDQKSKESFLMSWVNRGAENEFKESEVVMRFADFPQHQIGIFSSDLARYLQRLPDDQVIVIFELTYDFGCIRGFRETQIGALNWNQYKSPFGYSSVGDPNQGPPPWRNPWWCP